MSLTKKGMCLSLVTQNVTNSVKSFQLSKRYVIRLLKIGTLSIIYQRIEVPESEFVPKNYENIPYVVFKRHSKNAYIRNYHVFTRGFLDAIEKDYLKEIFMYILDKETGNVLETYKFTVQYNKDGLESNADANKVRNETMKFLKAFSDIPGEKWPSDTVTLSMEFSYNEDTPREYEPPNFEQAVDPLCTTLPCTKIFKLARISTGFHKVSAWGRGINFSLPPPSTSVSIVDLEDTIDVEEYKENEQERNRKRSNEDEQEQQRKKLGKYQRSESLMDITDDETNFVNITLASSEDLSCLCKWDLPKEFETARCTKCHGIVHLACHGYLSLNAVGANFRCVLCTDSKANTRNTNKIIKLKIILYGMGIQKALPNELNLASKEDRNFILSRLEKLEIYTSDAKNKYDINLQKLSEALTSIFANTDSQYLE